MLPSGKPPGLQTFLKKGLNVSGREIWERLSHKMRTERENFKGKIEPFGHIETARFSFSLVC